MKFSKSSFLTIFDALYSFCLTGKCSLVLKALWRMYFNNNLMEKKIFKHFCLETVTRPLGGICIARDKRHPFSKYVIGNPQEKC